MFPPKFQWLLKTHLPREVSPTVMSVEDKDTPYSTRLSLCSCSFDIFFTVLMITVGDYLVFFMSPSVVPLPPAQLMGGFSGPCPPTAVSCIVLSCHRHLAPP